MPTQSIQIIFTKQDGTSVERCEQNEATHCSVYLRDSEGICKAHKDFPGNSGLAKMAALICAAKLSMSLQVPIEQEAGFQ